MKSITQVYFGVIRALMAVLLLGMVILVFGNVALRYAFNSGVTVSEELSRIFFVWIVFLGAALVMAEHGHIGIDTVIARVPRPVAKAMILVSCMLVLFSAILLVKGSYIQSVINMTVVTPVTGMPMTIFYAAGVFFGASAIVISLLDLWRTLFGKAEVVLVHGGAEGSKEAEEAVLRAKAAEAAADRSDAR